MNILSCDSFFISTNALFRLCSADDYLSDPVSLVIRFIVLATALRGSECIKILTSATPLKLCRISELARFQIRRYQGDRFLTFQRSATRIICSGFTLTFVMKALGLSSPSVRFFGHDCFHRRFDTLYQFTCIFEALN